MFPSLSLSRLRPASLVVAALSLLVSSLAPVRANETQRQIAGHIPPLIASSQQMGRLNAAYPVRLALSLPLRNQGELDDLLVRLSDPEDALYGQYLTSQEFTARFAPTPEDYEAILQFAKQNGLKIIGMHPNRTILDVVGTAAAIERTFQVRLMNYQAPDGHLFFAPHAEPTVPESIASRLSGIVGLESAAVWRSHAVLRQGNPFQLLRPDAYSPHGGSGSGGGYTPSDIKTAYNLNGTGLTGTGQSLALFELDGYRASDITAYENAFGLTHTPLQNVLVDGFAGGAGSGAGEVTLDIELMIALAPGATKILVYEGPNSNTGVVDTYNRIATDNLAKQISTSWGLAELSNSASVRNSENTAFQQMAAQGQSIYAAAGDSGAYDNGSSLSVDDPASQPYMVGVGGTTLQTSGAGGPWLSEKTWSGGGGGISAVWGIPSYQSGVISGASKGSTTMRNVPDVSLDADPSTGYSIYYNGSWQVYGGTSCAAPLWAAFNALVNQRRVANGSAVLGFPNPAIYNVGKGARFTTDFHDIADNSTNQFYPAVTGYDDATGWGTFNGTNLLNDLAGVAVGNPPAAPTGLTATAGTGQVSLSWGASAGATSYSLYRSTSTGTEVSYRTGLTTTSLTDTGLTAGTTYFYKVTALNANGESGKSNEASATPTGGGGGQQLIVNPGFENGSNAAPWVAASGVVDSSTGEAAHAGSWKAWLNGYGSTHTDTLSQQVAIPSTITTATLTFYLHIDTAETTTTTAYDTLKVQVRNSSGTVLATLATYSNLNKATGFSQKSFNLAAYKGQTIQIYLVGTEDSSLQTSFVVDDFALNVQ